MTEQPSEVRLAAGQVWKAKDGKARRITRTPEGPVLYFLMLPGGKVERSWGHEVFREWIARNSAVLERSVLADEPSAFYTCAACGGEFEKGWADEDAEEERQKIFPDVPAEDHVLVCDDCYKAMGLGR